LSASRPPDGEPVHVQLLRPASERPALGVGLIHGLEETCDVWAALVPLLPATAEVHAFGLPWDGRHGQDWAWTCEPSRWIGRALALLPSAPSVLIAHSFGANAMLEHLDARGCAGIRGLVLISPFYRHTHADFDWDTLSYYVNEFHRILEEGIRVRSPRGRRSVEVLTAMGERLRDRIGAHGWLRFFDLFARTPGLDLDALGIPCLVLGGETDVAAWPNDCRALAAALPEATGVILSGCGHFPMLERPDETAALVSRFLARLASERHCIERPAL
jgi:pimeloyl-ACP methyl ester carboxylesterase